MLKDEYDINYIRELDSLIMHEIVNDIINGTLLLEADSETLDMMLTSIWEMRESYERAGVIIGDAQGTQGIQSTIRKPVILTGRSDTFPYRAKLLHLWEMINLGITSDIQTTNK